MIDCCTYSMNNGLSGILTINFDFAFISNCPSLNLRKISSYSDVSITAPLGT